MFIDFFLFVFFLLIFFSVAGQNPEAAAFELCPLKGASENLYHQYENLKFMKSMGTTTENINTIRSENDELSNYNNVGGIYGLISKRQLKDVSFSNTTSEGGLPINYEQPFQTSSQYNILSLKRNLDPSTTDVYV